MASCPVCDGQFGTADVGGVTVDFCLNCDGVWLDPGELNHLAGEDLESEFHQWMEAPTECRYCQTPLGFSDTCVRCNRNPVVLCAKGHGPMNATLVEMAGHEFEVDHCPSCRSIWIDSHERQALIAVAPREIRRLEFSHSPGRLSSGASSIPNSSTVHALEAIGSSHAFRYSTIGMGAGVLAHTLKHPGRVAVIVLLVLVVGLLMFGMTTVFNGMMAF